MKYKAADLKKFFVFVVIMLLFLYVYLGNAGKVVEMILQTSGKSNVGEIQKGVIIEQSFHSEENNINGFSVKFGTYMRVNQGEIILGIKEKTGRVIYSTNIKTESLADNQYYNYRFPPIKHSKGKEYLLFIESLDNLPGQSVTVYSGENDPFKEGSLFINSKEVKDTDLVFSVFRNKTLF